MAHDDFRSEMPSAKDEMTALQARIARIRKAADVAKADIATMKAQIARLERNLAQRENWLQGAEFALAALEPEQKPERKYGEATLAA